MNTYFPLFSLLKAQNVFQLQTECARVSHRVNESVRYILRLELKGTMGTALTGRVF